jgi:hypothetical protein
VKRIAWTEQAKADIRGLDTPTAMRILHALHRFAESGAGGKPGDRRDVTGCRSAVHA